VATDDHTAIAPVNPVIRGIKTMRKSVTIGGALLALAALASTADARMMGGGGGMGMSMSHGAPISSSMPSSMGSPRGFSPDGHSFGASGRSFSPDGFQTRVKGSNWKKPIDSDGGGPADPQPKPPKTQTSDGGDGSSGHYPHGGFYPPHRHGGGYYGGYHPNQTGDGNVPQRDCRGC
jgi:hypothetical protein